MRKVVCINWVSLIYCRFLRRCSLRSRGSVICISRCDGCGGRVGALVGILGVGMRICSGGRDGMDG